MGEGSGEKETPLEYTPTWVVASVCSVIVVISLALERLIHFLGKVTHKTLLSFPISLRSDIFFFPTSLHLSFESISLCSI